MLWFTVRHPGVDRKRNPPAGGAWRPSGGGSGWHWDEARNYAAEAHSGTERRTRDQTRRAGPNEDTGTKGRRRPATRSDGCDAERRWAADAERRWAADAERRSAADAE